MLSPGVVVEEGATVSRSVLLDGVIVHSGATVDRAVVDAGIDVAAGRHVGGEDVTLLGHDEDQ